MRSIKDERIDKHFKLIPKSIEILQMYSSSYGSESEMIDVALRHLARGEPARQYQKRLEVAKKRELELEKENKQA
jgi:hypothetical protein